MVLNRETIDFLKSIKSFKYFEDKDIAFTVEDFNVFMYQNDDLIFDYDKLSRIYNIYLHNGLYRSYADGKSINFDSDYKNSFYTFNVLNADNIIMSNDNYFYKMDGNNFECFSKESDLFRVGLDTNCNLRYFNKPYKYYVNDMDIENNLNKFIEEQKNLFELNKDYINDIPNDNIDLKESLFEDSYKKLERSYYNHFLDYYDEYIVQLYTIDDKYAAYKNFSSHLDEFKSSFDDINNSILDCAKIYNSSDKSKIKFRSKKNV